MEHLDELLLVLNQGDMLSALQKLQIKAKDEFMEMYNLISDRLGDAHDEVERKAKARAVQEQAWVFRTAFKAAFGSGSACMYTYYVHYVL
jgi:hypothetical protein